MEPEPGLKASAGATSLNGVGEIAKSDDQDILPDRSFSVSDFFVVSPGGLNLVLSLIPPVAASRGPSLAACPHTTTLAVPHWAVSARPRRQRLDSKGEG